jgi:CheY-like chemotaxis protein
MTYTSDVARPRVILACEEAEIAVRMIAALNPKRYRVEHMFDLSEALLRAKIVLAHALVIHPESFDDEILREALGITDRVSAVVVSSDPAGSEFAETIGARFVPDPFDVATFKRAVYRAVSRTQDQRQRTRHDSPPTGVRRVGRVLVLHDHPAQAAVMAAVLRNQLGVTTEAVSTTREALETLDDSVDCVVASPEILMATADGAQLAKRMTQHGIPVVPLDARELGDVSEAGRLAWDIAPRVRRSLSARDKVREAV